MHLKKYCLLWGCCAVVFVALPLQGCGTQSSGSLNESMSSEDGASEDEASGVCYDVQSYRERLSENRVGISVCREQYSKDVETLRESDYQNLHFDSCVFAEFPDTESVELLHGQNHGITVQESWDTIEDWLEEIGKSGEIDMDSDVYVVSEKLGTDADDNYYLFSDHLSDLDSGEGAFVHDNACHIQIAADGIYSMSDGTITSYLGLDSDAAYDAFGYYSGDVVVSGKTKELANEEYPLIDDTVSIQAGAELVCAFFEAGTPFTLENEITVDVPEVNIFRLGEVYGYDYTVRRVYGGIPFAYMSDGHVGVYGGELPAADSKHAYVVKGESVSAFCGYNESEVLKPFVSEQEILSVEAAAEVLSDTLTSQLNVDVEQISLVYMPFTFENSENPNERVIFPCWEFKGINRVKDEEIRLYVDVLTGDVHYYTYSAITEDIDLENTDE